MIHLISYKSRWWQSINTLQSTEGKTPGFARGEEIVMYSVREEAFLFLYGLHTEVCIDHFQGTVQDR